MRNLREHFVNIRILTSLTSMNLGLCISLVSGNSGCEFTLESSRIMASWFDSRVGLARFYFSRFMASYDLRVESSRRS